MLPPEILHRNLGWGLGFRALGFRVLGFRVLGLQGFRVLGFRVWKGFVAS